MTSNTGEIAEVQRRALWLVEMQQRSDSSFDFDLRNLHYVDEWIDGQIKNRGGFFGLTELAYEKSTILRTFGAFVGETLVRSQHGKWHDVEHEPYIVGDDDQLVFRPFEYVRRRLAGSSNKLLGDELPRIVE